MSLARNSGLSKDLRSLIAEFQGRDPSFRFTLQNDRVKVTYEGKSFRHVMALRPAPRDLLNSRAKLMAVLRSGDQGAVPEAANDVPAVPEKTWRTYNGVPEERVEDLPEDQETGADQAEAAEENNETEGRDTAEREEEMTEQTADAAEQNRDTDPDFTGAMTPLEAIVREHSDESPEDDEAADPSLTPFDRLSMIGDEEVALIERVLREGMPSGAVTVTPDMVGATLMIHEGRIVIAPAVLTRIAALSSGQPPRAAERPQPVMPEKVVRRADAVSRRMGQIPTAGGGVAEMVDALMDIFSKHPHKPLRSRDIYSALPETIRKRYSSMESCRSCFSRPMAQLIESGLIGRGAKIGREETWHSL